MKKCVVLLLLICIVFLIPKGVVFADSSEEEKLQTEVDRTLSDLDMGSLEEITQDSDNLEIMTSFEDIVKNLVSANYKEDNGVILNKIINKLFSQILSFVPIMLLILAIAILGNIVDSFKPGESSKAISNLIHFVCVSAVVVILISVFKNVYTSTTNCVDGISKQMEIIYPILLTLLSSMGSVVSASIYQPVVGILTNGVCAVFKTILYPIFIISFLFVVLGNITSKVKLNKFTSFLSSLFKWVVGFVFTMFAGFLTIKGISAGRYDTISLKATRFAMKSYVPIIGGYLSDGLDYAMLGSAIIKNAVGVAGLLLMFSSVVVPIITIVVLKLCLQLVAGVLEPIGDSTLSKFCDDVSKILIFPIVIILSMAFMYLISVSLIMCTFVGV